MEMKCFFMKTPQYEADAKKYSCLQVFNRFKRDVEGGVELKDSDYFSFGNFVKRRHQNFRTIFQYRDMVIDNQSIRCYVALKVFTRGNPEYEEFYAHNTPDTRRNILVGTKYADWDTYSVQIAEMLRIKEEPKELPALSQNELNYIQRSGGLTHEIFDTKLLESKYWVETVRNKTFRDFNKIGQALQSLIENSTFEDRYGFIEGEYGEKGMRFLCVRPENSAGDSWYLLKIGTADELNEFRREQGLEVEPNIEILQKMCCRAYPYSMMENDLDFWMEMEQDDHSNFILSEEELKIVSSEISFPLFLTGRAGSGKSTMLQYLFAEYFLRYLEFANINPPVYISYSSNLIDNAKKLATNLFCSNHAYTHKLNELKKNFERDICPHFESSFFVFQSLVRKCIEERVPGVLVRRFIPNKRITYVKFREKWQKKFGRNPAAYEKFGPAISWHVIRTYIKGWNAETYLTPDLYQNIGKANKSVSDEMFKTVYEEVWEKWYSTLMESEFWDDQDLVRYCLAPDDDSCETCVTDRFSAIFCDESQDFTRAEIDFILRISSFSRRRIYDENTLYQIPFIFAGDEFQTLNPTGFSWSSLRSYFTTQLMHVTMSTNVAGAPQPRVLTQNYRSPAPVTKVANRLQLLSQTRCHQDERFTPQIPYHIRDNSEPVLCLSPDSSLVWKKLSSIGAVLIIPCSEGQSPKEFIEKSGIREHFQFYEDGSAKNITILNPSQAKGLEYPCVAIYGFDGFKELGIQNLMNWYSSDSRESQNGGENESKEIEIKYFLSNAYVSVTRASSRLFILSDFSEKSFWAFAFATEDQELYSRIEKITEKMIQQAKWGDQECADRNNDLLGYIVRGDIDAVTNNSLINIEELAVSTCNRAMELSDAGLMRQAAARFREQGKTDEVTRCLAYASRFDGDFREAARNFERIGEYENALDDYWNISSDDQGAMGEILQSICALSGRISDIRVTLAEHALKPKIRLNDFKLDLFRLTERLEIGSESMLEGFDPYPWKETLNRILKNVPSDQIVIKNDVNPILDLSGKLLDRYSIEINRDILAMLAFRVEEFRKAVALWESGKTRPQEYYRAQCRLLPYPDNLQYREQTGDESWMNKVVEDWRAGRDVVLDSYQQKIVSIALVSCGNSDEISESLISLWSGATDMKEISLYSAKAQQAGVVFPAECLEALSAYRFGELSSIGQSRIIYKASQLNILMKMLQKVREIRKPVFLENINAILNHQDDLSRTVNSFFSFLDREFGNFSFTSWNWILLYELGVIMERREYFLDAQLYYEWAQKQTQDLDLRFELGKRWIICRFAQARKAKSEDRDRIIDKALEKAREIGVVMDPSVEYPMIPNFSNWKLIYREVLSYPCDLAEKVKEKNPSRSGIESSSGHKKLSMDAGNLAEAVSGQKEPVARPRLSLNRKKELTDPKPKFNAEVLVPEIMESLENTSMQKNQTSILVQNAVISEGLSSIMRRDPYKFTVPPLDMDDLKKQISKKITINEGDRNMYSEYFIKDYKFRYNPEKSELSITLENKNEDLSVKIRKGEFPKEGDFAVDDGGRLIKSEDKAETPFSYARDQQGIKITDEESGMIMIFPLK